MDFLTYSECSPLQGLPVTVRDMDMQGEDSPDFDRFRIETREDMRCTVLRLERLSLRMRTRIRAHIHDVLRCNGGRL